MSLYHYIASSDPLPVGEWSGRKPPEPAACETLEAAAGIYIHGLAPGFGTIRKHFQEPYVYVLAPNGGKFHFTPEMKRLLPDDYRACVKCVTVLFDFMRDIGGDQSRFELYSCWIGEEDRGKREERTRFIHLSSFRLGDRFELQERQYISIVK